jgi:hypothetical protein
VTWKGRGKQVIVGKDRPLYKPEIDPRDVNRTRIGLITERDRPAVSKMTPMQGPNEVYQLYVPGLGRPHNQFSQYFNFLSSENIATGKEQSHQYKHDLQRPFSTHGVLLKDVCRLNVAGITAVAPPSAPIQQTVGRNA